MRKMKGVFPLSVEGFQRAFGDATKHAGARFPIYPVIQGGKTARRIICVPSDVLRRNGVQFWFSEGMYPGYRCEGFAIDEAVAQRAIVRLRKDDAKDNVARATSLLRLATGHTRAAAKRLKLTADVDVPRVSLERQLASLEVRLAELRSVLAR